MSAREVGVILHSGGWGTPRFTAGAVVFPGEVLKIRELIYSFPVLTNYQQLKFPQNEGFKHTF